MVDITQHAYLVSVTVFPPLPSFLCMFNSLPTCEVPFFVFSLFVHRETETNDVYTWGGGCHGQLGHGDTEDRLFPALVKAFSEENVLSVTCGFWSTVVIVQ